MCQAKPQSRDLEKKKGCDVATAGVRTTCTWDDGSDEAYPEGSMAWTQDQSERGGALGLDPACWVRECRHALESPTWLPSCPT